MQHFLIKCQIYIIACIVLLFTFRYHVIGTFARLNAILLFPCDDSKNGTFKLSFLILPVNKYCNKIIIVGYLLTCMNWYVCIFNLYFLYVRFHTKLRWIEFVEIKLQCNCNSYSTILFQSKFTFVCLCFDREEFETKF